MNARIWLAVGLLLAAAPVAAQESDLAGTCAGLEVTALEIFSPGSREICFAAAQAVESAQPQLGIAIAAGNPTIGSAAGNTGIRLGLIPRTSVSVRANVAFAHLPKILAREADSRIRELNEGIGIPVPTLSGDIAVGLLPGASIAPTLGGIGSVTLLGNVTWLPLSTLDVEGFEEGGAQFAYGVGARIGLLRESFTVPAASVSLMYRRLDRVAFGDVCAGEIREEREDLPIVGTLAYEACPTRGDPGEFSFDLKNWSARAAVGKTLLGIGATAGVGYDRFGSDIGFGFRSPEQIPGSDATPVFRRSGIELDNDRWSAFGSLSYTLILATLAVEGGWMQGGDPVAGFEADGGEFDPREGTFFGSVGLRLSF